MHDQAHKILSLMVNMIPVKKKRKVIKLNPKEDSKQGQKNTSSLIKIREGSSNLIQ